MASLPPHRHLLTRLVDSFAHIPPRATSSTSPSPAVPAEDTSHDGISDKHRLLLTLHVIFPGLLLPAFDLLDRGLVTRLEADTSRQPGRASGQEIPEASTGVSRTYLVRSLAATLTRGRRDISSSLLSKSYIVHLDAWNCSCASFTLDAFTPTPTKGRSTSMSGESVESSSHGLTFGGSSLDGWGAEDVPCCKHLLASLLVERWGAILETRVEVRKVTKEELATIVAGL